jgi:hypothetical protein
MLLQLNKKDYNLIVTVTKIIINVTAANFMKPNVNCCCLNVHYVHTCASAFTGCAYLHKTED